MSGIGTCATGRGAESIRARVEDAVALFVGLVDPVSASASPRCPHAAESKTNAIVPMRVILIVIVV